MKQKLVAVALIIAVVILGSFIFKKNDSNEIITNKTAVKFNKPKEITACEAAGMLKSLKAGDEDFLLIDVRTIKEFNINRLNMSIVIDFYNDAFESMIGSLNKDGRYILYCDNGKRSKIATNMMSEMGFKEVYNLQGGIELWQNLGYPVIHIE